MKLNTASLRLRPNLSVRHAWIPVVLGLLGAFYLQFSPVFKSISIELQYFILLPLLWLDVALYAVWGWLDGLGEKPKPNALLMLLAITAGLVAVLGSLISGRLWGFGYTPYTREFPQLLGYLFYVISTLLGLETARSYLLILWSRKSPGFVFVLIILSFTLLNLPPGTYRQLMNRSSVLFALAKTALPSFSQNLLLTYIVWIGGPWMAIIYRLWPLGFEWLSPILPDPDWPESTFINTLLPIVILMIIHSVAGRGEKHENVTGHLSYAWLFVSLASAGLLWLNAGLFGFRTFLVTGRSMEPELGAGDLVFVQTVAPEEISAGEIILFDNGSKMVLHRVVGISRSGDEMQFVTQGDSNRIPDKPVSDEQIRGKAILKVPKIGWLSLNLRRILAWLI